MGHEGFKKLTEKMTLKEKNKIQMDVYSHEENTGILLINRDR